MIFLRKGVTHQWCDDWHARLQCCRSWVRVPVGMKLIKVCTMNKLLAKKKISTRLGLLTNAIWYNY